MDPQMPALEGALESLRLPELVAELGLEPKSPDSQSRMALTLLTRACAYVDSGYKSVHGQSGCVARQSLH